MRTMLTTFWRLLATGSWGPLVGKALVWLGAFAALTHVGSGAAARLAQPPQQALAASPASASSATPSFHGSLSDAPAGIGCAAGGRGTATSESCGDSSGGRAVAPDGRIILNLAAPADLVRLPGIGTKRAQAIVALRKRLGGRFRRLSDLLRVRGIGYHSLKRLRPLVVLDPPTVKPKTSAAPPAP